MLTTSHNEQRPAPREQTPAVDFETLTVELFQLIVMRKAQGRTWVEIAQEVPLTVGELERLPWSFPEEWDHALARALALYRQDMLTPCVNKVQTALLAANEPHHLGVLSRALTTLLKPLTPSAISERRTRKAERPEAEDEDEIIEVEQPTEEAPKDEAPKKTRAEEIAELLEKEEERIFNEQLQKKLSGLPDVIQRVQELAQQNADRAPVPDAVEPTEPPTNPTPANTSVKKAAGWAALIFVLFFLYRGLSRAAEQRDSVARDTVQVTNQLTENPHLIWPLSGDD